MNGEALETIQGRSVARRSQRLVGPQSYNRSSITLSNLENLPEKVRTVLARELARDVIEVPPVLLLELENVWVLDNGVIFLEDGRALSNTVRDFPPKQYPILKSVFEGIDRERAPRYSEPLFAVGKHGFRNYGHWLVEMLPRVEFLDQLPDETRLLVGETKGALRTIVEESLALFEVGPDRLVFTGTPIHCEKLFYATPHTRHPTLISPRVAEFHADLGVRVGAERTNERRLFVSRRGAPTRALENEDLIFQWFESTYGFERIETLGLSLADQVRLFSQAQAIVGVSGAAMTNAIFANGADVLHLSPATMPNLFFVNLADLFQHRYADYKEIQARDGMFAKAFSIDVSSLQRFVHALGWF